MIYLKKFENMHAVFLRLGDYDIAIPFIIDDLNNIKDDIIEYFTKYNYEDDIPIKSIEDYLFIIWILKFKDKMAVLSCKNISVFLDWTTALVEVMKNFNKKRHLEFIKINMDKIILLKICNNFGEYRLSENFIIALLDLISNNMEYFDKNSIEEIFFTFKKEIILNYIKFEKFLLKNPRYFSYLFCKESIKIFDGREEILFDIFTKNKDIIEKNEYDLFIENMIKIYSNIDLNSDKYKLFINYNKHSKIMKFFINIKHYFANSILKNEKGFKMRMNETYKNNNLCWENLVVSLDQIYKELDDEDIPDESKLFQITHTTNNGAIYHYLNIKKNNVNFIFNSFYGNSTKEINDQNFLTEYQLYSVFRVDVIRYFIESKEKFYRLEKAILSISNSIFKKINSDDDIYYFLEEVEILFKIGDRCFFNEVENYEYRILTLHVIGIIEKLLRIFYLFKIYYIKYESEDRLSLGFLLNSNEIIEVLGNNHCQILKILFTKKNNFHYYSETYLDLRNKISHGKNMDIINFNKDLSLRLLLDLIGIINCIFFSLYKSNL